MKNYFKIALVLTILNIFCLSQNGKTQNYLSIFAPQGSTTNWNIAIFNGTCVLTSPFIITDSVQLNGKYYKMFSNYAWGDSLYIREDITNGKVWARTSELINNEKLLVDMSLNVGDTFTFYYPVFYDSLQAVVNNIYTNYGRKVIEFDTSIVLASGHTQPLRFVEGIGREIGLLHADEWDPWISYYYLPILLCVHYDSLKVYQNPFPLNYPQGDSCDYFEMGINEKVYKGDNLFYNNPVSDNIDIIFSSHITGILQIFNLQGVEMLYHSFDKTKQINLPLKHMSKGIYLIKIFNKQNKKITKIKIIKI